MRYWSRRPISTEDELRDYMKWNVTDPSVECYAITARGNDLALGWIALIDRKRGAAELGFILCPKAQGKGFAKASVKLILTQAFGVLNLRRVFADIDPDNQRSIQLVERLGYQYEGRLRATWVTHLGVRDSAIYSILKSDASGL